MKFFKYWAKASEEVDASESSWKAERYGASNTSLADAQANAQELAKKTAQVLADGEFLNSYLYSDRPVREEIIEEFGDDADPYAVITRNAYGSLVLNTARVLFADIDNPKPKRGARSSSVHPLLWVLGKLLGISAKAEKVVEEKPSEIPGRVAEFVRNSPGLGLRLYRTAAGFRCLVTSHEFDPLSEESDQLLMAMNSDPLYVKLCQVQECFRARLTPKFWRCGVQGPAVRFPWADATQEQKIRDWEQKYNRSIVRYATCELVETLGSPEMSAQIASIVELHDHFCCQPGKPLA